MAQARQGQPVGAVYEWHPGGKVTAIAGTELAAPNGIEVSADGKTLYVTVFGTHEFVRFMRGASGGCRRTPSICQRALRLEARAAMLRRDLIEQARRSSRLRNAMALVHVLVQWDTTSLCTRAVAAQKKNEVEV